VSWITVVIDFSFIPYVLQRIPLLKFLRKQSPGERIVHSDSSHYGSVNFYRSIAMWVLSVWCANSIWSVGHTECSTWSVQRGRDFPMDLFYCLFPTWEVLCWLTRNQLKHRWMQSNSQRIGLVVDRAGGPGVFFLFHPEPHSCSCFASSAFTLSSASRSFINLSNSSGEIFKALGMIHPFPTRTY
jgi:hypothetical protein